MNSKTSHVLKMMYWGLRRDWRNLPHLIHILVDFCRVYVLLLFWKYIRGRRSIVMIGHIESMGDIVATEPISRMARQQFPDSYIVWVARKPFRDLAQSFTAIDNVVTVVCLTEWMLLLSVGACKTVWDLHLSDRICLKCFAPMHKPGFASRIVYETYYDFGNLLTVACLCAGLPPIDDAPVLKPDPQAIVRIDGLHLPRDFVVLHCTSNDPVRNWSQTKWKSLVTYITETTGKTIVEIGLRPVVVDSDTEQARNLCGKLSILETAEVIRRAALFIGIDSGPAHLANAVGTPGVILLGKWFSWVNHMPFSGGYQSGDRADLVRISGPLADLPTEAVVQAVASRLKVS